MSQYQVSDLFLNETGSSQYQVGLLFLNESVADGVINVSASSSVTLTDAATFTAVRNLSASSTVTMTSSATHSTRRDLSADNTVTMTDLADLVEAAEFDEDSTSTLTMSDAASFTISRAVSAENTVTLTHSAVALIGRAASAENTVTMTDVAQGNASVPTTDIVTMSDLATAQLVKPTSSTVTLTQTASFTAMRNLDAENSVAVTQSASYVVIRAGGTDFCDYSPFVGSGDMPTTITGPTSGVTARFALIYPSTGSATDTVELRPPVLGNRHRLAFDRINRETRGGTLIVFADPMWPKVQTLVLNFQALCRDSAYELVRFMKEHLGEEIKLTDWEQRAWIGIITTPDEPVIQDGKNSFSASFQFEGELIEEM